MAARSAGFDLTGLPAGSLVEPSPEANRAVFWLPRGTGPRVRHWERLSTRPETEVWVAPGLRAVTASCLRAEQPLRGLVGTWLARLLGRPAEGTWILPDGMTAEQRGGPCDVLLVSADDPAVEIGEALLAEFWPWATGHEQLGRRLFLVRGAEPPSEEAELLADVCPLREAEALLAAARQSGDRRREAAALNDLAFVCAGSGDVARALSLYDEALRTAVALGDAALEADVRGNLALALLKTGQAERALGLLQAVLASAVARGDRYGQKLALERLGFAAFQLRSPERALAWYEQARVLARELGDVKHEAELLWIQAVLHAERGCREQTAAAGQSAVALLQDLGHPQASWFAENLRRFLAGEAYTESLAATVPGAPIWTPQGGPRPRPGQVTGPGVLRLALAAAKSLGKLLGSGLRLTAATVYRRRREVCATCDYHTGLRCRVCGCFTDAKARFAHERCPLGRWPG